MASQLLKSYYLNLLSKKDYSEHELRQKAAQKGYSEDEIEIEVNFLIENNYLNDRRFAENIVNFYRSQKGINWIKQKLSQKRISQDTINQVLKNFEETVNNQIKEQVERKYKIDSWRNLDYKTKQKVANFLAYRGFSNPFDIVKQWTDET